MHIWHILTVIFVVCKIGEIGVIADWSWWLVLAPSLISAAIGIAILAGAALVALIVGVFGR